MCIHLCYRSFLSLFTVFSVSFAVTHKLQYFYTFTSGVSNFPEFMNAGVLDGVAISRYDSNTQRKVPLQKWMEEIFDQQYWDSSIDGVRGKWQVSKANIQTLKERFNQTEGESGIFLYEVIFNTHNTSKDFKISLSTSSFWFAHPYT